MIETNKTVAQHATEVAQKGRKGIFKKIFVTGRVLVKEQFEDTLLNEETDVFMYLGPELTKTGATCMRLLGSILKDETPLNLRQTLDKREKQKTGEQTISIFDASGKVSQK